MQAEALVSRSTGRGGAVMASEASEKVTAWKRNPFQRLISRLVLHVDGDSAVGGWQVRCPRCLRE